VKAHLDVLRDGFAALARFETDLSDPVIDTLVDAAATVSEHLAQLDALGAAAEVEADAKALREHLALERPWIDARTLEAPTAHLREHYVAQRKALLGAQEREAEAARSALKRTPGFERLGPDAMHRVLRPITEAAWDTTADAVAPRLVELRDGFARRLAEAKEVADERLVEELQSLGGKPIVPLAISLRGRTIESRADLDALLREIEARITERLAKNERVRLT
jgi:hypothetical protein